MTAKQRVVLSILFALAATAAHAQSLTIAPQQVYVLECQETFVTLTGTNLTGTASTLVDFSGNSQFFELEPNTATATQLEVWIPLGVAYAAGDYSVTVKATDAGSGTRTIGPVTLSVIQRSTNAPPLISLPEVVTAETTSSSGTSVTYDAGGASCSPPSGSLFPVGTTTVTCSMSNGFGTTTGTFSVVVTNTAGSPPAFSLPEVIIAEATSAAGAVVTFNASGATCDHASGATYPLGDTTVTCSATNSFGTTTVSMTIAVFDTTPPVLNLPSNFTTSNPVVTYSATATDAVDGSLPASCSPPSGSTFPDGPTVVQCSATDSRGNTSFGNFTVTVHTPQLSDFTASQDAYQLNAGGGGTVMFTSNVPLTLTETLTIRSVATGQTVRTLFNGTRNAGTHQDVWNGTNDAAQLVPDGTYRYFVTVSANGSSFTWDQSTSYAGSTLTQLPYAKCRNDAGALVGCDDASITFDPYANRPMRVNYCVGGGDPPTCTAGNTPYVVVAKAVSVVETDEQCRQNDCFLFDYQASGAHEVLWYGRGYDSVWWLGDATGLTVVRRTDIWPKNMTVVYGTAPVITNFTIPWPVFNPAAATDRLNGDPACTTMPNTPCPFRMNVTTFQSRSVTITGQFKNLSSGSILRTITTTSQAPGQVYLYWNGRADNGAWVSPGLYEAIISITDSAGSSTVLKPLLTVRYE